MKRKHLFFLIILVLLFWWAASLKGPTVLFQDKGSVSVEVANTPEERALGLMHRPTLEEGRGMLFVFDTEEKFSFWMKNTLIPLDIIYLSKDLRVVDIIAGIPCVEDPCESYTPKEKALYVLEVNQGYVVEQGIIVGDKVKLKHI